MALSEVSQEAMDETSSVVPFSNWAVAVNCTLAPGRVSALGGVTTTPVRAGASTDRDTLPEKSPSAVCRSADTPVSPAATPVARPPKSITAMPGSPVFQLTSSVTSVELPSLNVALAEYCWLPPSRTDAPSGETTRPVTTGEFSITFRGAVVDRVDADLHVDVEAAGVEA